jgi:hypothetical protein
VSPLPVVANIFKGAVLLATVAWVALALISTAIQLHTQ